MGRHQKPPPKTENPPPPELVNAMAAENPPPVAAEPAASFGVEQLRRLETQQPSLRYEGRDLGELFTKIEPGSFPVYDVTPDGWVQMMADARGVSRLYVVPERSLLDAATDGELAIYRPADRKALRIRWTPTPEKEKSDG